jgi:hypothetical protein
MYNDKRPPTYSIASNAISDLLNFKKVK